MFPSYSVVNFLKQKSEHCCPTLSSVSYTHLIKDNYFLEVSSPGLDRPLKKDKDFERYKGRDVEIKLYKPMNGSKQFEGELVGLTEDNNIKAVSYTHLSPKLLSIVLELYPFL